MSNPTIPAAFEAMPTKTRRAALGALFSAPALAILPAIAVASPTSSARLADLIAVHHAAVDVAVDAEEARVEAPGRPLFFSRTRDAPYRRRYVPRAVDALCGA